MNAQQRYVKAMTLKDDTDIATIDSEIQAGNILILKITPLVVEDAPQIKEAIREIKEIIGKREGDIARLGEERIVLTPKGVRIWRGPT
ncbi:MAG: cell division protein SepF [Candidatus Bathyarchaeota archaeon]|nr:MAG: cell division protein SepF [Candidatus Bathyarchaeota archaeon]